MKRLITLLFVMQCFICHRAVSQEKETTNTLRLTDSTKRDKARIEDIKWLSGHWVGTALGGVTEEVWTPPMAGSMMGSFRMVQGDTTVVFFEILNLCEEYGSLSLKLKHFNKDLTGWEEKDKVIEFKLIKLEPNKAYFEGMTLHRKDVETLRVYLAIKKRDGSVVEEIFDYTRKNKLE